jgi:hypothetical protein
MLDGGESEVTGSAAVCAADLVYYAAEGERLVGLVKTIRLARHSLRSACSRPYGLRTPARGGYAMQKQQRAKAGMISVSRVDKGNAKQWHELNDNKSKGRM